jgi:hypothetical protein
MQSVHVWIQWSSVLSVTLNTGTGHAVSRGTTVKGWCCSSKECCGGREQRILCRKNIACYKVSESASGNDGFLKKFHKRWGGGGVRARELFQKRTDLLHCLNVYDATPHHTSNASTNIKQVSTKNRTEAIDFSHNILQRLYYIYTLIQKHVVNLLHVSVFLG